MNNFIELINAEGLNVLVNVNAISYAINKEKDFVYIYLLSLATGGQAGYIKTKLTMTELQYLIVNSSK